MTGGVVRSSKANGVRYERAKPGELVHMDVKKLGKIPDGGGWRAHGRAATVDYRRRRIRVGSDYVHSLVDDHSRLAYCGILPDEKGGTCAAFLERAATYFAANGIPRIDRVTTDNAFACRPCAPWCAGRYGASIFFAVLGCPDVLGGLPVVVAVAYGAPELGCVPRFRRRRVRS